jgi:hypothetical protein
MAEPRPLALALAAVLLAGCILGGGGPDDLSPVCERKDTTPWRPYSPDDLLGVTTVPQGTTDALTRALLQQAAPRVVTQQGAPYDSFRAELSNDSGTWSFHAHGTLGNFTDAYDFPVVAGAPVPDVVPAPATLRYIAWHVANETPETSDAARNGTLVNATWSVDLPGCVQIVFAQGPPSGPASTPTGGTATTTVTVGFDLYRVVDVHRVA